MTLLESFSCDNIWGIDYIDKGVDGQNRERTFLLLIQPVEIHSLGLRKWKTSLVMEFLPWVLYMTILISAGYFHAEHFFVAAIV